jgi:hypothetical protein
LENRSKRDKEKQPMRMKCDRPIKEREKDGQPNSPMVKEFDSVNRSASQPIGRWSTKGSTDGKKKAAIKEIRQKESMVEAGQSTIGNGSKSQY